MALTNNLHLPEYLQRKPLIITAAIHALLLLMLLLWRFSVPVQTAPLPEMGMEVNLGTSPDGSGTDQPMDMEDPAPEAADIAPSSAGESADNPEVERSDDDNAPSVAERAPKRSPRPANNTTAKRPGERATSTTTTAVQPQRPRYVYPGGAGRGGNSASTNIAGTGEGNTTGPGDRGVPRGTPGATNYAGSPGLGTGGISHSISGRNIVAFPPKDAKFREGGRVVVRVTVDRDGIIVNRRIKTSTNSELSPIALRQLQQVRFNKSETAPEEQFGDIIFVFKTRR